VFTRSSPGVHQRIWPNQNCQNWLLPIRLLFGIQEIL
jgi:hypothetical protein